MTNVTSKLSTSAIQQSALTSAPLTRDEIAGNFSLIGNGPVVIDAAPGLTVHVRSGLVQICHPEEEGQQLVGSGQSSTLNRSGPIGLAAITPSEVRLQWPLVASAPLPRASARLDSEAMELYAYA